MTEPQAVELGYELERYYTHDQFHTKEYKNKNLQVDFTYEGDKLHAVALCVHDIEDLPVTYDMLQTITPILCQEPYYAQASDDTLF